MWRKQLAQFNHIMQGIENIYEDYAKSVGITYMSLVVLELIYHTDEPYTQKDICNLSHYNKQVVNSIIKSFYDKGYIALKEVPDDRRNKHILLTESGQAYTDKIMQPLWKLEQQALSVLTDDERNQLLSLLGRCYEGYKKAEINVSE